MAVEAEVFDPELPPETTAMSLTSSEKDVKTLEAASNGFFAYTLDRDTDFGTHGDSKHLENKAR